ncbi:hypothetical protein M2390_002682 [Mycetocola sp. BIGb0189]|uniref:DUF4259 domain-containing protein n=1 Tax=Mycetocola sp. BIGb0189 TaxID=2940604 RepID=UPI0021683D54|nr:DUF4259 domain-containing protein [Mycetocola sp. BIGb0189]MCS4277476.1 hypothetical protein [Mycetocola sp. BIGb0189]
MGAWETGAFDNDGAGDLIVAITEGYFTFESVACAFEDEDYVEVDGGQIALALAELAVRSRAGEPLPLGGGDSAPFAALLSPERIEWIRTQATRTLAGAETSELYELWEEAGELEGWLADARATLAKL